MENNMSLVFRKQASETSTGLNAQQRADELVRVTYESHKEASMKELATAWEKNMIEVLNG